MKHVHISYAILFIGLAITWTALLATTLNDANSLAKCQEVVSADNCQYILR